MGFGTSIEWTDLSWPIVNGCEHASPGCMHCYAEQLTATRLRNHPKYQGLAVYQGAPRWTRQSRLWHDDLRIPLKARGNKMVFVANMGDLFWEEVPVEWIDRVFATILACRLGEVPKHTFQILTKRAARMCSYVNAARFRARDFAGLVGCMMEDGDRWHDHVYEHVRKHGLVDPGIWLGVSAENQEWADKRVVELLQTEARVRYVSAEPLLGPIDFCSITDGSWYDREGADCYDALKGAAYWKNGDHGLSGGPKLDWIIPGGESGAQARPCELAWLDSIVGQCAGAGTACFLKQIGSRPYVVGPGLLDDADPDAIDVCPLKTRHPKGGDPLEWPHHLRVRQFPEVAAP